jgi:hypothetical protein
MDDWVFRAVTALFASRASRLFMSISLLLCAATPACGGGPGSGGTLQDNASAELSVVADAGPAVPFSAPPTVDCLTPEQGCSCATPDETISCHAPILRDGDYVTCEGTRVCVNGAWGPCWPLSFSPAGTTGRRR